MSIIPYNNYSVLDLSGQQQPYVNSTTEFGRFNNSSSPQFTANTINSLNTFLLTNNGLAIVDGVRGLRILAPGVYKLKLSLDLFTASNVAQTNLPILFFFGTTMFFNSPYSNITGTFGSTRTSGMFSFGENSQTYPGIISWITNSFNSGTTSTSNFLYDTTNRRLLYRYYCNTDSSGNSNQGICTTEITFIIDGPTTIYFNTFCTSTLSVASSYFTLKLISSFLTWTWTPRRNDLARNWQSIASSSDGTKLAAVINGGRIWTSTDSGQTWRERTTSISTTWTDIASSSDGTKLAAISDGQGIWMSTDSGDNWISRAPGLAWFAIASSSNGNILAAVVNNGNIWVSTNSGQAWSERSTGSTREWRGIASSSDGVRLAAVANNGQIWTSINSGQTWSVPLPGTNNVTRQWRCIASSSNGQKLAAVVNGGRIWTSTNFGETWTPRESPDNRGWQSIASSSDGTKLAAVVFDGQIYTSTDSGETWTRSDSNREWSAIASSSDGSRLVAGVGGEFGGFLYTGVPSY